VTLRDMQLNARENGNYRAPPSRPLVPHVPTAIMIRFNENHWESIKPADPARRYAAGADAMPNQWTRHTKPASNNTSGSKRCKLNKRIARSNAPKSTRSPQEVYDAFKKTFKWAPDPSVSFSEEVQAFLDHCETRDKDEKHIPGDKIGMADLRKAILAVKRHWKSLGYDLEEDANYVQRWRFKKRAEEYRKRVSSGRKEGECVP
jgi:hypothetical protein